ncbi:unnamed protein product [Amoebophrya sp. A120]|nr:unnamed protein product [Amoebophrya sp. A120]|eukprot:GSA120T00016153001.1
MTVVRGAPHEAMMSPHVYTSTQAVLKTQPALQEQLNMDGKKNIITAPPEVDWSRQETLPPLVFPPFNYRTEEIVANKPDAEPEVSLPEQFLPPSRIIPECRKFLESSCAKLSIPTEALQKFAQSIDIRDLCDVSCAKSSPAGAEKIIVVPERDEDVVMPDYDKFETRLNDIARILAYNVINFSFFPDNGKPRWFISDEGEDDERGEQKFFGKDDEAFAIVEAMKRLEKEVRDSTIWRNGHFLQQITVPHLENVFRPAANAGSLPLLPWRMQCLRSLGDCYSNRVSLEKLLEILGEKPTVGKFVYLLCKHVPAFRDLRRDNIEFAKRPQLAASMLHADKLVVFSDLNQSLTVFSDYRLPQLFLTEKVFDFNISSKTSVGTGTTEDGTMSGSCEEQVQLPSEKTSTTSSQVKVTKHSTPLLSIIENCEFIPENSDFEVSLRAGTIVACADLLELLRKMHEKEDFENGLNMANLDYYLWRKAVQLDGEGKLLPFHRTRTYCY